MAHPVVTAGHDDESIAAVSVPSDATRLYVDNNDGLSVYNNDRRDMAGRLSSLRHTTVDGRLPVLLLSTVSVGC